LLSEDKPRLADETAVALSWFSILVLLRYSIGTRSF